MKVRFSEVNLNVGSIPAGNGLRDVARFRLTRNVHTARASIDSLSPENSPLRASSVLLDPLGFIPAGNVLYVITAVSNAMGRQPTQ